MNPIALIFALTVGGVWLALTAGVKRAAPAWAAYTRVCIVAWLVLSAFLAQSGWLAEFDARPPHFLVFVAVAVLGTIALALSPFGARMADGVSWAGLLGFQVFRVPVEWVLLELAQVGIAPPQMTLEGRNFDLLTGVTAPIVAWLAATGRLGPRGIAVWNALGLALLVNVMTVAMLSTPTPLRVFTDAPALTFVAQSPWQWLPGFLVPAALFGHLVAFRKLRRMR